MKFLAQRDVDFFRHINREIVDEVIETNVIVFKLSITQSPANIYGEALTKSYHVGTQVTALINREDKRPDSTDGVLSVSQDAKFSFLRDKLQEVGIYPEVGDIIEWDNTYWEINNAAENQNLMQQTFYDWSLVCDCHLTKRSALQLEERQHLPNRLV